MAKKKYPTVEKILPIGQEAVLEEVILEVKIPEADKEIIAAAITPLREVSSFSVKATGEVKFRKLPSMKDTADNIQGKMLKGKIYKVMSTINYTPMKMYKLENGFYIIADQNIQVV